MQDENNTKQPTHDHAWSSVLHVDSRERKYGSSSSDLTLHLAQSHEISKVLITNVTIPNGVYNIRSSNNTLTTSDGTVTLEPGFYNIDQVVSALNTDLQVIDASYSVSYNAITSKVTIVRTGSFSITYTDLLGNLGFVSTQTLSASATYTGSGIVNLNTLPVIYVECPELQFKPVSTGTVRPVLFTWPLQEVNTVNYISHEFRLELPNTLRIHQLEFRLTDHTGSVVDMNGIDWSFSMYF